MLIFYIKGVVSKVYSLITDVTQDEMQSYNKKVQYFTLVLELFNWIFFNFIFIIVLLDFQNNSELFKNIYFTKYIISIFLYFLKLYIKLVQLHPTR